MTITQGFGTSINLETGTAKPWAFRAAKRDDGTTYWPTDQICPVPGCGSNCSTNGRVVQCMNPKCGWDDAEGKE